jgi:hypothetical protein
VQGASHGRHPGQDRQGDDAPRLVGDEETEDDEDVAVEVRRPGRAGGQVMVDAGPLALAFDSARRSHLKLEAARRGSVAGSEAAAGLEESLWLCPIEDRCGLDSSREGMMQGFSLWSYVKLVDYAGRLYRQGKASISAELAGIFERLGCSAQSWEVRMEKLRGGSLLGPVFATTRAKLRETAERLGVPHVGNLAGAQRDDTILNRESRRTACGPLISIEL